MNITVYIALGTNLGDREMNLRAAREALAPQVRLVAESPVYETAPWGFTDQPHFLNQVIQAEATLTPTQLLAYLKAIESRLGRKPTFRYGPRQVDLDILFYGDEIIQSEHLTIPHPRLHERAFVLVPLADLAADLLHPGRHQTVRELLAKVDKAGVKRYLIGAG